MCKVFFVFTSLLYSLLETLHIYTSIINWVSPGGFVEGHVDQKLHLFIFHVCLVLYQH
jgi:hypothetical protein